MGYDIWHFITRNMKEIKSESNNIWSILWILSGFLLYCVGFFLNPKVVSNLTEV